MFTFVFVVAISAFIPYVATPAVVDGVKAITSHPSDKTTTEAPQSLQPIASPLVQSGEHTTEQ